MNKPLERIYNGVIKENPTLVLMLGMCPTLAVTTSAINGVGMGLSTMAVLIMSNLLISALRKVIPDSIRIACFVVVIATFVTIVDLMLQAFIPALADSLGVFIPLIVVNCIILGRAEAFCYKNGVAASAADGVFQGIGYTWVLVVMCLVREFLGNGTILGGLSFLNDGQGIRILPEGVGALGISLPVGGFLVLACLIAFMQWVLSRDKGKKTEEVAK